jgi:DNA-binding phage protein
MTIPFKTTSDQVLNLAWIMVEMKNAGLDHHFIVTASELARVDQGVYDLMALWLATSGDPAEREEILADIQESLDDYADAPSQPVRKPYITYNQLEDVAQRVMAEKVKLRQLIDRHGGVSAVAQKSGIPQPSLSRMLNSPSIPRRSTLYKIANALDLSEEDIVMEWIR